MKRDTNQGNKCDSPRDEQMWETYVMWTRERRANAKRQEMCKVNQKKQETCSTNTRQREMYVFLWVF